MGINIWNYNHFLLKKSSPKRLKQTMQIILNFLWTYIAKTNKTFVYYKLS